MSIYINHKRELSVVATYLLLLCVLAVLAPSFFSNELFGTWIRAAPVVVAAIGMTLLIVSRQIDISIGSQFCVCSVLAGLAAKAGWSTPVIISVTLIAGALMGAVNGALVTILRVPAIVATLTTMVVFRECIRWAREGEAVNGLPASFQWFGFSQSAGEYILLIVAIVTLVLAGIFCRWVTAGRTIYAVGSDASAARLAGISPDRVAFNVFVLMGVMVGLAALLNAVRFPQVDANAGFGLELQVIAAVVVGGCAITGGRGTMGGTLAGVALLTAIGPALVFLHLQPQWEKAIQGLIILIAVASDGFSRRTA